MSKLKGKSAKHDENRSYDEIYELFKREEKAKNQIERQKKKKSGGIIVLKKIQISTPTVNVRGKKKEHFKFDISPINLNNSTTTSDNLKTTKELCDSLRRQRLKEIKEQEKNLESSAILRAKALLEKLRMPRNPPTNDKKNLSTSLSLDLYDEVNSVIAPPSKSRLTKRQLSLDDSEIKQKSSRKSNQISISQNFDDDDVASDDITVDHSVSKSLSIPSIAIHDASQIDEDDENLDENQDSIRLSALSESSSKSDKNSQIEIFNQLSESSLKLQKTQEIPAENKSIQLVEVLNNLISNRKSKQNLNDFVTTRKSKSTKTITFVEPPGPNHNDVIDTAEKSILKPGRWRRSLIEWRKSRCTKSLMTTVIEENSEQENNSMTRYSERLMDTLEKCKLTFFIIFSFLRHCITCKNTLNFKISS